MAVEASLTETSRCTLVTVGFGEPHQLSTDAKSTDCLGTRAVILYGPVPMAVAGLVHQLSKSCLTAFWSTIQPVLPPNAMAVMNQPAGVASLTCTVVASGAVRPLSVTDGSFFSSRASRPEPLAVLVERVVYPSMAERLVA